MPEWSTKFAGSEFEHRFGSAEVMAPKGEPQGWRRITRTPAKGVWVKSPSRVRLNSPGANLSIDSCCESIAQWAERMDGAKSSLSLRQLRRCTLSVARCARRPTQLTTDNSQRCPRRRLPRNAIDLPAHRAASRHTAVG